MNHSIRAPRKLWPDYRSVWRWHFYAGLFCTPFVLWLACTGSLYLFRPQVEAWLDRPYESLRLDGPAASAQAQVAAALAAVPGARLHAYQLPLTAQSAVQVLVGRGADEYRVYVHPQTLQILKQEREEDRPMRFIFRLHGELLLGDRGSMLVELAASWAIIMIVSGLFLWWPRQAQGLGGVLYPRLGRGGRTFWRDLHAVTGLWVSAFALFLLLSGLPWAKSWGGNLKALRQFSSQAQVQQDWSTGSSSEAARQAAMNMPAAGGEHHHGNAGEAAGPQDYGALDRLVATVQPLQLPPPVLITPPSKASPAWSARSDAQNRPQRVSLTLDGASGAILQRQDFSQRPLLDRIIGVGTAAHEGQLFGWTNQLLGLLTALGLITISLSALKLWWSRRPDGTLGAPALLQARRLPLALPLLLLAFGILLPLFGASIVAVLLAEWLILRRIPQVCDFLGLGTVRVSATEA
ncbi:MAG: hypothetical protein JWR07_3643 [Nevskia sp.]|nr:hypothetical protein [Nevskia sp.]